ncbi:manganese peroxidase [Pholiota conissans]|uniref:Peroxidase n=1 Tax=Pholiota conissans TaxID=109636 RepID=A0A9P6CP93_9AGAR|nr:manganese peroxidase [Pholiota conissans]
MAFTRLATIVSLALGLIERATCTNGKTAGNAVCCPLFDAVDFLQTNLFDGGECGEEAHSALRLTFHDAIEFSIHGGMGGGADGSILVFNATELQFHANRGIDDITSRQFPVFQALNEQSGLSGGDFVHLAGAVGTANCPGAPRLEFMLGRLAPVAPAPDLTIPEPTDTVTAILARFADAGFSPEEVIVLLSSHTIAAADDIDTTIPGTPFDSTVNTFDTQIFLEVLLKGTLFPGNDPQPGEITSPIAGEMLLQSDFLLSQDSRTACFLAVHDNQERMTTQFKAAMAKLQTLGQNTASLVDCSDVIPVPAPFPGPIKFPPSFSKADLQIACTQEAFPSLATVAGPAPTLAPVPAS